MSGVFAAIPLNPSSRWRSVSSHSSFDNVIHTFKELSQVTGLIWSWRKSINAWRPDQLHSHLQVFPEGQFVAVEGAEQARRAAVAMQAEIEPHLAPRILLRITLWRVHFAHDHANKHRPPP